MKMQTGVLSGCEIEQNNGNFKNHIQSRTDKGQNKNNISQERMTWKKKLMETCTPSADSQS